MKTNHTTIMSQWLVLVSSLTYIGASLIPGETRAAEIAPGSAIEWQFQEGNRVESVVNNGHYTLWNTEKKNYVKHGARDQGIRLVWADTVSPNNIRIVRPPSRRLPAVVFGDRVAIHVEGGGYLVYHEGDRKQGLNLRFVEELTPEAYQWQLRGATTSSDVVSTKRGVALFNSQKGDYVVQAKRAEAIDLRWYKDSLTAHK